MNILLVISAVAVLVVGIFTTTNTEQETVAPTPTSTEIPLTPTETPPEEPTSTPHILLSETPKPTNAPVLSSSTNLDNFIYPNATIQSKSDTDIMLTSTDNTSTITSWYKTQIKNSGMNATSTVQTSTNDNIQNVLAGSSDTAHVHIEITKTASNSVTNIHVSQ